jgi:hypothetical protein
MDGLDTTHKAQGDVGVLNVISLAILDHQERLTLELRCIG